MLTVLLICVGIFLEKANFIVTEETQNFAVRLNNSGSDGPTEGRLEIYYSGIWGTVCDNGFTNVSARVACASLGFGYMGAVIGNHYGAGEDPIWLDDLNCAGTETGIEQCAHRQWGSTNCSHSQDVSIRCVCTTRYFDGLTGKISSPNFPMAYANGLRCYSNISAKSGYTVIITFLEFKTEPCCDWVTITCASGKAFASPSYSGFELPSVLTISSCTLVNVYFYTDGSVVKTGFSLTYNLTSDIVNGGFTTKPSNAFPRSDKSDPITFNCTAATKYLPWWTIQYRADSNNYTMTNSTCGVINSTLHSSWFKTETLGPGSCNLIVVAPANNLYLLAGSVICTDSTLSSARAILAPINLELRITKVVDSSTTVTDIIRDEKIRISCNPTFLGLYSGSSLVFTNFLYSRGPVMQMSILRTYWTSQGNVVSSIDTSNTSSYVLVKAPVRVIPRYTCNIVCDFFSNISEISGSASVEISFSTEPLNVLYWPTEEDMKIIGDNNGQIRTTALLYCNVAANPPATYTWIDESNGNITNGPTIIVIHGGEYTCNASTIIRGQYYQQSKSINLQEDGSNRTTAIILGVLLGAAVLTIIILSAILLSRKYRQPKPNSDVGHTNHGNEQELRQRGGGSNRYEAGCGNDINVAETEYENLDGSQRPFPNIPAVYEELNNRK